MKNFDNLTTQRLQFFVTNDINIDENVSESVKRLISEISTMNEWIISPPSFIDTVESIEGDLIKIVGGYLEIYSALDQELPYDIDAKNFEEVNLVINKLRELSKKSNLNFELYLDDTFVGEVIDGEIDHLLQVGLINEWKKMLLKTTR